MSIELTARTGGALLGSVQESVTSNKYSQEILGSKNKTQER